MPWVTHTFPPVWDENSRILILGTMPSPASRENGFYYGHVRNRFWEVVAAVLQAPVPGSIREKKTFLKANGIALFDVLQGCDIFGAADSTIRKPVPNDFGEILKKSRIRAVFTTGRKATVLYDALCFPATGLQAHYLPSPSPANCAQSMQALIEAYRAIRPYLEEGDRMKKQTGKAQTCGKPCGEAGDE